MRVVLATAVLTVASGPMLLAHGSSGLAVSGPSAWDLAALGALTLAGALYAIGSVRLARRGARVRLVERVSFAAGWSVLVAAVAPPMDRASSLAFSVHMAQHELLMLVGAPLVIVGRPIPPWLWALPERPRPVAGAGLQPRGLGRIWRTLTTPVVAWALHGLTIWIWHLPPLYEAAIRSEALHAVQHAMFVGTAVLFWWGLVYGRYGRVAYGASVLYVFTTMVHTGVLGALFALSTSPFYPIYRDRAGLAGVDPAVDQQLAGLYMWIPAGVVLTVCGLALLVAWLAESERRSVVRRNALAGLLPLLLLVNSGCGTIPHEREARLLTGGDPHRGRERIRQYGCDSCHTIPGIPTADAAVGPPLTGIARRTYLAGRIENTPENMMRWIEHPQAIDERTVMPDMGISRDQSRDIAAYLYTLR